MHRKCPSIPWLCALALILGALAVSPATAQTVKWVDQAGGSDANDGNTEATAYATLQFGIDNSVSGGAGTPSIINVKDGAYQTLGQNACGFTAGLVVRDLAHLTIQAVPGHEPVALPMSGTSLTIEDSSHIIVDNLDLDGSFAGFDRMHVCGSSDVTLKNSTVQFGIDGIDVESSHITFLVANNTFRALSGDAVDFSDGSYQDITIQDNTFTADNRRPILIRILSGLPIRDFIIRRNISLGTNDQEAFRLIGVDNVLVENNVLMNSHQQALYIDSGCSNITVRHNTFYNSDQECFPVSACNGEIRTKVTSSDIVIQNNILVANGVNPVFETSAASLPGEDFNLIFNDTSTFTFGANTIFGDPLFVSTTPGSEDLHLTAGSPAIEAAPDLGVTDDKDQGMRPNPAGTDPDMGAYEFAAPEVCDAAPNSQGYWHRQCLGTGLLDPGRNGRGPQEPLEPEFEKELLPAVNALLEGQMFVFNACSEGMDADPASDPCQRALKQYTALLFNLESGRLQNVCTVDLSAQGCNSTNVGDLVGELAGLIQSQDGDNCQVAADCAEALNTGGGLTEAAVVAKTSTVETPVPVTEHVARTGGSTRTEAAEVIEAVVAATAKHEESCLVVGVSAAAEVGGTDESPTPEPAAGATSIRRHLAVLSNATAPQRARDVSINALLTVLSGGYDLEVRLTVARALIDQVDVGLESLLIHHVEDLRHEAAGLGRLEQSAEADRLLERLAQ